jgi:hypothetical protein
MLHNKTAFGSDNDNYLNMTIEASPVKSCILLLIGSIEILFNGSFQYLTGLTKAFTIRIQSRDRKKQTNMLQSFMVYVNGSKVLMLEGR